MSIKDEKLSARQIQALIFSIFSGVMVTVMPFRFINVCGDNIALTLILGGITAAVFYGVLSRLFIYVKDENDLFFKILCILAAVHMCMFAGMCTYIFSVITSLFMLPEINKEMVAFILVLCAYIASSGGIKKKGRMSEITAVLMILGLIFVAVFMIKGENFERTYFKGLKTMESFRNVLMVSFYFDMSSFLFVMLGHYGKNDKKCFKTVGTAVFLTFIVLAAALLAAANIFGSTDAARRFFAAVEVLNDIDFPGSVVQRQEILIMGFIITSFFMLISTFIILSSEAVSKAVFGGKKFWSIFTAATVFIISILPNNTIQAFGIMNGIDYFGALFSVLAVLYVLTVMIRRKRT
ncbi:MAG: spore germination protein [Clostridia bacterium]|jgi:spore germination protein|nr:spore germination protein [Clostridia bacterium]MCI2013727.1 spore germination protein [Clostridia bacterium]